MKEGGSPISCAESLTEDSTFKHTSVIEFSGTQKKKNLHMLQNKSLEEQRARHWVLHQVRCLTAQALLSMHEGRAAWRNYFLWATHFDTLCSLIFFKQGLELCLPLKG